MATHIGLIHVYILCVLCFHGPSIHWSHISVKKVFDGSSNTAPLLQVLCGYSIPANIMSTGNELYVTFYSDAMLNKKGFVAAYTSGTASM